MGFKKEKIEKILKNAGTKIVEVSDDPQEFKAFGEEYMDAEAAVGSFAYLLPSSPSDTENILPYNIWSKKIYDYFINLADCDLTDMNSSYFYCDDQTLGAFCRGAFLVAGSITDPKKEYHLEMVSPYESLANSLVSKLSELGFAFKFSKRASKYIVYSKDSETIEDFLTFTGATTSCLEIMNVKVVKQVKNKDTKSSVVEKCIKRMHYIRYIM